MNPPKYLNETYMNLLVRIRCRPMRVCLWLNSMNLFCFACICVNKRYIFIYLLFQRIAIIRCTCIKDMERISRMLLVDPKFLTVIMMMTKS